MDRNGLYLASASPRRAELLTQIGVPFRMWPADVDESALPNEAGADMVLRLARRKAQVVAQRSVDEPAPVLGADTAVIIDGDVLGKPGDLGDAARMLERLSGRVHQVVTAVALVTGGETAWRVNVSEVRFRSTTERERLAYCRTEEPLGKAGGYAIQGLAAVFVTDIKGSFSGVMGLPVYETTELLRSVGLPNWLGTAE